MTTIIGSTALKHWFPEAREPGDVDALRGEYDPYPITESISAGGQTYMVLPNADVYRHLSFAPYFDFPHVATPDELYTIKVSHSFWELPNRSWSKHMADLLFLKRKGAKLIPDLYAALYKVWEEKHGRKKVNLQMEADDFFRDAVKRVYDHDSLHRSVAYTPGKPLYESILSEDRSVAMDMAKLKALPYDDQVRLFREEIYATALERKLVPTNYAISPGAAYIWALRRTITSLTKGWSALFIVENFDVFRRPDVDYLARHLANRDRLIRLEN